MEEKPKAVSSPIIIDPCSVLIVGGYGFVGRHLARRLQGDGFEVSVVDDFSVRPESRIDINDNAVLDADMCDVHVATSVLRRTCPDVVFWLAAKQGYGQAFSEFGGTNVAAVYSFFEALMVRAPVDRPRLIVLLSSQAVYTPKLLATEDGECDSPSLYGFSKLQQEQAFRYFCRQFQFQLIILRPSIILGAGQSLQSTESGILRNWLRDWQMGRPLCVYGTGEQVRDFVHVSDVVSACRIAIDHAHTANQTFNLAGFERSISDMAKIFSGFADSHPIERTNKDVRPGGEYSLTSSKVLTLADFGWWSIVKPDEQVKDFLNFAKNQVVDI